MTAPDKRGRRLISTFTINVEVRFDVGQLDVPKGELKRLANEEWMRIQKSISILVERYYPHININVQDTGEE